MRMFLPAIFALTALSTGAGLAQTTTNPAAGGKSSESQGQAAVTQPNTDQTQGGSAQGAAAPENVRLEAGANSFTEAQVRSRLQDAGFQDVSDLSKDDQGIWRGKAMKDGRQVNVGFDFKGNFATQ